MKDILDYMVYEVHQVQAPEWYWQAISVTCSLLGTDYAFKLTQQGPGSLSNADGFYVKGGTRRTDLRGTVEYQRFVDDAEEKFQHYLSGSDGCKEEHLFGDAELKILVNQIANDEGKRFPRDLTKEVRETLRLLSEEKAVEQVSSSELTWLANFWGATA